MSDGAAAGGASPQQGPIRVAILGAGMMGQEHVTYLLGYKQCKLAFLCDPCEKMLHAALKLLDGTDAPQPTLLHSEDDLFAKRADFDLLVIATPNFLHTPMLLRWGMEPITILCEKPIAVNANQVEALRGCCTNLCRRCVGRHGVSLYPRHSQTNDTAA